jgi:hypothetical protein
VRVRHQDFSLSLSLFFFSVSLSLSYLTFLFPRYEFRWRAKRYELDETVVSCALKRSACTYAGDILIGCTAALDDTYLAGYQVNVELKRVYRNRKAYPAVDDDFVDDEEYPKTWWGVRSCHATAIEVNYPPDTIEEKVKFYWTPKNYVFDEYELTLFFTLPVLFFYLFYVRYFATECVICAKKNAFLNKQGVCVCGKFVLLSSFYFWLKKRS